MWLTIRHVIMVIEIHPIMLVMPESKQQAPVPRSHLKNSREALNQAVRARPAF